MRTALEMGLIEALIKDEVPRTATELADKTSGDKLLIGTLGSFLNYANSSKNAS